MLFFLHIYSFPISYDSRDKCLGEVETTISWNQSREMCYDLSVGKFDF